MQTAAAPVPDNAKPTLLHEQTRVEFYPVDPAVYPRDELQTQTPLEFELFDGQLAEQLIGDY